MSYVDPTISPTAGWYYGATYSPVATAGGIAAASAAAPSVDWMGAISPGLSIASLIINGAQQLGANAANQALTNEEINLKKSANTTNRNELASYLATDFENVAKQQRDTLANDYQATYEKLMTAWGGQSATVAASGQEAVAGGSAAAIMNQTQKGANGIEYFFGSDLQNDNVGGMAALATANLEADIKNSRTQIENAISAADQANTYYDKATLANNMTWWDKIGLGIKQFEWDVNKGLGLNKNYNAAYDTYKYKDLINK